MKKLILTISFLFCLVSNSQTITVLDTLKACHDCHGFGRNATGARGLPVYKFNSLSNSGAGTLRQAIADASSGGYIFAEVAGNITLTSSLTIPDNVYFAGQTAFRNGGQGITIRQNATYSSALISSVGDNSIIRYIRLRRGAGTDGEVNGDDITITSGTDIVIDHCSLSWSTDETFNTWGSGANNITLQYSIISEALQSSTHSEGNHSKSTLFGNGSHSVSLYRSLWMHNDQRNPLIGGEPAPGRDFEISNILIGNYGTFGLELGTPTSGFRINIWNSKAKIGGDTNTGRYAFVGSANSGDQIFVSGNITPQRTSTGSPEWNVMGCKSCGTFMATALSSSYQTVTPHNFPLNYAPMSTISELETTILPEMGASLYEDSVDARMKDDYLNGTGSIIDDPSEVGGWPTIANMSSVPTDTDDDGIPDAFESEHSITDANATKEVWYFYTTDHYLDNSVGYTNIEIYLMSLTGELMKGAVPYDDDSDGNIEYELDNAQKAGSKNAIQNKLIKI